MKTKLFFLILLTSTIYVIAQKQTYDEPQWKLRLFFEDATGAKDTLIVGYDPTASIYLHEYEPQFGEVFKQVDTTQFNVYTQRNAGQRHPTYPPIDTDMLMKTTITSWYKPYTKIGFVHGLLPVTMTWEEPQLNSAELPSNFIAYEIYPRARIDFWLTGNSTWCIQDCYASASDPSPPTVILASDINYNGWCWSSCKFTNELVFDLDSPYFDEISYAAGVPYIIIVPYKDAYWCNTGDVNDLIIDQLTYYPNPITDLLFIEKMETLNINKISIYDVLGNLLFTKDHYQEQIDLTDYKSGVYLLVVNTDKGKITKKIIKK